MKHLLHSLPSVHRCARQVKRIGRLAIGRDAFYRYDARPPKRLLGTVYGGWMIVPSAVRRNGVVYSFGVGNDISFDVALIDEFGVTVHGFDPSPSAIDYISRYADLPERYQFHNYGLGSTQGDVEFFHPIGNGMYSMHHGTRHIEEERVKLSVKTLSSIMADLHTDYIDVLKMDIEGAEYDLIETLIGCSDQIGQLLIEFHHRIGVAPLKKTIACVDRLRQAGFQLFHVSGTSSEFSFLRNTPAHQGKTQKA